MAEKRKLHILEDEELDDPILSVVNAVDVFLVIIAILFIIVMENPLNPFNSDKVIVVKNPGEANMEMTIKDGEKMEKYQSTGKIGQGEGMKAGVTYRLKDGSFVYVPEDKPAGP
ncbi:hypothetical protein BJL95_19475 [Methylomonas sp. LWB]|uniref:DUF2149 domain-containing protein n=1 Tax=Methylomonas sp. LWB TaxID=1905845 RepID=UPI0008D910FB|nr:DUF2149 domain-containing protein [Methylomonas sp. LWB]OHX36885.1 hypothetical protein BJL95_19475 [Methylomonas sp. LWB]